MTSSPFLLMLATAALVCAQQPMAPQQLDNLVAPVALYPDSLLSQVLVACTYPDQVADAGQWLQQYRNLRGPELLDAARQQNWDASVQALVVFPDVVNQLNQDLRWAADLGNAFLAQEGDVMDAVQRMRARANADGRLVSTPQQRVIAQGYGPRTVIEIEPANPEVVYVPVYDPEYIWGPPVYGYYPRLYYPRSGMRFGFGSGIAINALFGGGGWRGWGWGPSWHNRTVVVNNSFFDRYRFNDFHGRGDYRGSSNRYRGAGGGEFRSSEQRFGGAQARPAPYQAPSARYGDRGNYGGYRQQAQPYRAPQVQAPAYQAPQYQAPASGYRDRGNYGGSSQQVRPAPQDQAAGGRYGYRGNNGEAQQVRPVQPYQAPAGRYADRGNFRSSAQEVRPAPRTDVPSQPSGNRGGFHGEGYRGGQSGGGVAASPAPRMSAPAAENGGGRGERGFGRRER